MNKGSVKQRDDLLVKEEEKGLLNSRLEITRINFFFKIKSFEPKILILKH